MAFIAAAIIGGVGAVAGGAIAAHGASSAANAQANAANTAAELQHQDAQAALDFQKQQWNTAQGQIAPWLTAGQTGLANLMYGMGMLSPSGSTTATATPGNSGTTTGPDANLAPKISSANGLPVLEGANGQPIPDTTGNGLLSPSLYSGTTPLNSGVAGPPSAAQTTNSLSGMVNPSLMQPGSLLAPWTEQFTAPSAADVAKTPGYQFNLEEGLKAINRGGSAAGNLLSGTTSKALTGYGENLANTYYNDYYNRAMNEYATRYNTFENNQANQFNRLAAISGIGQTAATNLGQLGQSAANNISNTLLTSGQQIGNNINNAGAARASGYVGGANAWGGALSGLSSSLFNLYAMKNLLGPQSGPGDGWT